jgi:hypothetical protein
VKNNSVWEFYPLFIFIPEWKYHRGLVGRKKESPMALSSLSRSGLGNAVESGERGWLERTKRIAFA